jgi:hypothetical protein
MQIKVLYAAIALFLLAIVLFLLLAITDRIQHRIRVNEADGVWCIKVDDDGDRERIYGFEACNLE